MIPILDTAAWQMVPGERAALEGLLSQVRPGLAIEIGTAEGGSLRCISNYSGEVLSFDLVPPGADLHELSNVTFHTGDNHELLPSVLTELAEAGRNVDFAMVDGDHTASGVERDVRDLLASDAIRSTLVVFHDTMNDEVRAGLQRIDYAAEPKVAYCDIDFVSGQLNYGGVFHHQLWGGLGVMVVDAENASAGTVRPSSPHGYPLFNLVAPARDALVAHQQSGAATSPDSVGEALGGSNGPHAQSAALEAELADLRRRYERIASSRSWRLTAPLRAAAHALRDARARRAGTAQLHL